MLVVRARYGATKSQLLYSGNCLSLFSTIVAFLLLLIYCANDEQYKAGHQRGTCAFLVLSRQCLLLQLTLGLLGDIPTSL
jgi:hypothetical protein